MVCPRIGRLRICRHDLLVSTSFAGEDCETDQKGASLTSNILNLERRRTPIGH